MNNQKPKRETVFLGDEIQEYLESLNTSKNSDKKVSSSAKTRKNASNLLACWQRVAPSRLLNHTDNVVYSTKSQQTEVLVYVDSAVFATELTMDKELYRLKMQQEAKKEIYDIKFLVSRKSAYRKGRT